MKKYPYTDSTDMIVYEHEGKKEKKHGVFKACIASALTASIFTGAIFCGLGIAFYKQDTQSKNNQLVTDQLSTANSDTQSLAATTLENGKQVLTTVQIAEKCGPSIVGVINKTKVTSQKYYDPFSGRYYYYQDPSAGEDDTVTQGSGSGIIISDDGYIVTNEHVIEGATKISVILNTGEEYEAALVGKDTKTDLAVLKIEASTTLTPAVLGDSDSVKVGESVVAIGNPLGQELSGTTTHGIISAVNRTMTVDNRTYNLLQTDAAINSGNSGGGLFNQYGEVIGINSIKINSTGVEGIGFAISISEAKSIIEELMSEGHVSRPLVGIEIKSTPYGLFIDSVVEGSGAEAAGLQAKDMIIEVDGKQVSSTSEINQIRDTKQPGDKLSFKIARNGQYMDVDVTLGESTEDDN